MYPHYINVYIPDLSQRSLFPVISRYDFVVLFTRTIFIIITLLFITTSGELVFYGHVSPSFKEIGLSATY